MILKFSSNTYYDFGVESVTILKDYDKQLVKQGSAGRLFNFRKTPGQTDVHVIALGATEGTGYNRNLDGFSEEDCRSNHHYFKKAGRALHRHHKNKKKDPKYGDIKDSIYNEDMKRIELIVGHDNDKCQDILHEIETKGQANYSMASAQDHDVCTWCKHKAKTSKDRCKCIPKHLGELNKEGQICAMDNPDPHWFEISYVRRPADRIGMSLKVASHNDIKPLTTSDYLNLYPDIQIPEISDILISKKAEDKRVLLDKWAAIEKHINGLSGTVVDAKKRAFKHRRIDKAQLDEFRKLEPKEFFKLAVDNGIILSPEDFVGYIFGNRVKEASINNLRTCIANVDLTKAAGEIVNNEHYETDDYARVNVGVASQFNKLAREYSVLSKYTYNQLIETTLSKEAADHSYYGDSNDTLADGLAKEYVAYKLAALNQLNNVRALDDETFENALIQHLT